MKKGFTIGKARSALYRTGKVLGDINSVKRGKVSQRVTNRIIGKVIGKISSKISQLLMNIFK